MTIAHYNITFLCSFKQIIIGFLVHSLYGLILSFNSFHSIMFACNFCFFFSFPQFKLKWFLFRFDFYLTLLHPHNSHVLILDQLTTYFSSSASSLCFRHCAFFRVFFFFNFIFFVWSQTFSIHPHCDFIHANNAHHQVLGVNLLEKISISFSFLWHILHFYSFHCLHTLTHTYTYTQQQ